MSASGVAEFAAADDLTLLEGMARAARLGLPGGGPRRERRADRAARGAGAGRGSHGRAPTTSPRGRSSPSSRRSSGRSCSPPRPAARCTSSMSAAVAAWRWIAEARARGRRRDLRDLPALPGARRRRRRSGSARPPSARRRCARGRPSRSCGQRLLAGDIDLVATDHSPSPAVAQGHRRRLTSPSGAASRAPRRSLALVVRLGRGRPRPGGRAARDADGRRARGPLRPGAGQGHGGGRRRRGPRASRPRRELDDHARGPARSPPPQPVRRAARCVAGSSARCCGARPSPSTADSWASRSAACCAATARRPRNQPELSATAAEARCVVCWQRGERAGSMARALARRPRAPGWVMRMGPEDEWHLDVGSQRLGAVRHARDSR